MDYVGLTMEIEIMILLHVTMLLLQIQKSLETVGSCHQHVLMPKSIEMLVH